MIYKTIPIMERPDGSLQIDTNKVKLTQGDYNFNINYFTKEDYSNVSPNINVQVSFRRKDGQQTGWLPLTHIRGNQYTINLKSSWFTNVPGNMYVTFRVFQTTTNDVNLIINTTSGTLIVNPTSAFNTPEPDIIPSEFEVYMSQTNGKFKEVDEELSDLRNDLSLSQLGKGIFDTEQELLATYPNGIDYPEGTWAVLLSTNTVWLYNSQTKQWYNSGKDVTEIFDLNDNVYRFAKQLYYESKNEFDISKLTSVSGNFSVTNQTIVLQTNKFYCGSSTQTLKDLANLKVGKSYVLSFKKTNASANNRIYLANASVQWDNGTRLTITQAMLDSKIAFYNTESGENTLSEIMISENGGEYNKYNPNRHITNSEAEFLKEEHDKQSNLLPLENKEYSFEATSQYGFVRVPLGQDYTLKAGTYVLDFKMKAGSDTGVFNKFSFDYGTTSKFVVGTQSSVSTSYSNINRTFTLSEDITYNAIWIQVAKIGNYSFKEVFVGKKFKEYQHYNSSSHITNAQADFLKSEYDKSLNLSKVNSSANGNFNLKANIESGKTYTISFYCNGYRSFSLKKNNNSGATIKTSYDINGQYKYTFTADWTGDLFINAWTSSVSPTGNSYSNIMLNEGSTALPYQEYNGKIIHEKDITPILWWKNGNPNVAFAGQQINGSLENAKSVEIYAKYYALSSNIGWQKFEIMKDPTSNVSSAFLTIVEDTTVFNRKVNIDWANGYMLIDAGKANGTEDNNRMVPVLINIKK